MGAEGRKRENELAVREFRMEDAARASEILLTVREAASWSSQGLT
jgi:hypothetical protein